MTREQKIQLLEAIRSGTTHPDLLDVMGGFDIAMPDADGYVFFDKPKWGYPERMDAQTFARYCQRAKEYNTRRRAANVPFDMAIIGAVIDLHNNFDR